MGTANLEMSTKQMYFVSSEHYNTVFCGGLGSGKTFAGAVWTITMALRYPQYQGVITANSYKQLNRATLKTLFEILDKLQIRYRYKEQKGQLTIGESVIHCVSMENYDDLRGPEYGWGWSDECAFYKEEAFDVLRARIRRKGAPCLWKGTTTPNGYNWLYTKFKETPLPDSILITSSTADNLENLDERYYEALKSQYDSKLAEQELEGQFVNLTSGKVYYQFDRKKHCKEVTHEHAIIYVGLDFNVHPLCGVFCVQRDGVIQVVDELYLEDSNTFEAAKEIIARYPFATKRVVPDDSGSKRKTSAPKLKGGHSTDHRILVEALGKESVVRFRNPEIKDRYNNVNRLLEHNKLVISPNCKKLIEDLEKMVYDNKDPMLSHISDALGYACWHLDPLKRPKRGVKVRYI